MPQTPIQKTMFAEIADSSLYTMAQKFINEYTAEIFERNVFPSEDALKNLEFFEESLPINGASSSRILNQLHQYGSPATTAQIGGRYFGFVNGGIVPAGLFAKILSSIWDQNTAMQIISPLSSKLEKVVENWLRELFNLPKNVVSGFVSGTSMGTFCGIAAARYRILKNQGHDINEDGLAKAPSIRVIASVEAHSTVIKAICLLGLGKNNVEWVDTDEQGRIKVDEIPKLDSNSILILQAGNVNSGSFDFFSSICSKAKEDGAWIHIDGAFGLWAGTSKNLSHLTRGIEKASSWSVDGHKTLNTPYDSGIILCADKEALVSSLHMSGGYLILGEERDGMFLTPEMSRRSRIIELWATIKSLGKNGIDEMIYEMHMRTKQFASELSHMGFEILNEVVFNQCVVFFQSNEKTEQILKYIQNERVCWCGGSTWKGKNVIRISVCSWATTDKDVKQSVESFQRAKLKVVGTSF